MAFANKNLSLLAYANGFSLWHYVTEDYIKDVCTPGYFDSVYSLMESGNMIIINALDAKCIRVVRKVDTDVYLAQLD